MIDDYGDEVDDNLRPAFQPGGRRRTREELRHEARETDPTAEVPGLNELHNPAGAMSTNQYRQTASGAPALSSYFHDFPVVPEELDIDLDDPAAVEDYEAAVELADQQVDAWVQGRDTSDLPKWKQARIYDRQKAQLWLWYTFRAEGGRLGSRYNKVGMTRLGRMFCDHYGLPVPENENSMKMLIKRWLLEGRQLAMASKALPYEERLAERRSEMEDVVSIGYMMRNKAVDAVNHRGEPAIDMKLLEKSAKTILAGSDRLAILDGLDAPVKMAIKQDVNHSGGTTNVTQVNDPATNRIAAALERAEQRALAARNELAKELDAGGMQASRILSAVEDDDIVDAEVTE